MEMSEEWGTQLDLLNRMPGGVGVCYLHRDGRAEVGYLNDGFYAMLGEARQQRARYAGSAAFDAVHDEDREPFMRDLLACARDDRTTASEIRLLRADGSYTWYQVKASLAQRGAEHDALYLLFVDINELKLLQHKASHIVEAQKTMEARLQLEQNRVRGEGFTAFVVSDLSAGTIVDHSPGAPNAPVVDATLSYAENTAVALSSVVYDDDRREFERIHGRDYLLDEFYHGRTAASIEFRRRRDDAMIGWVRNVIHLVEDPSTGHVFSYEYCYDITSTKSVEVVTNAAIIQTFDCLSSIDLVHDQTTYLSQENIRLGKNVVLDIYHNVSNGFVDRFVVPEERADCRKVFSIDNIRTTLAERPSFEHTYHVRGADGTVHTMRNKYVYYDEPKHRCLMTRTDVTQIVREEEANLHNIQLAEVMGAFPGGIVTIDASSLKTAHPKVRYCSDGAAALGGFTVEEFTELFERDMDSLVFPSDREPLRKQLAELADLGRPVDVSCRLICKDGSTCWMRECANIMKDEGGCDIVVTFYQNISEDSQFYHELIDTSDDVLQVIDRQTREVYYANEAAIAASGRADYAGMRCYEFFAHRDTPCEFCNFQNGCISSHDIELRGRTYATTGSLSMWHGRKVFFESLTDITKHRQMQGYYENYIASITRDVTDAMVAGRVNVTRGTCERVTSRFPNFAELQDTFSLDDVIKMAVPFITSVDERGVYARTFSQKNLLNEYNNCGNNTVSLQHHCELENHTIIILLSCVKMTVNPATGDIEGILYARDITQEAINTEIFNKLLTPQYEGIELIDTGSGSCSIRQFSCHDERADKIINDDYEASCRFSADLFIHPDDRDVWLRNSSISNLVERLADAPLYTFSVRNILNGQVTVKKCTYCHIGLGKDILMGTIEDITDVVRESERQKDEIRQALVKANAAAKAKTDFLSLMSHDMRTPLNGILGLSYLMVDQSDPEVLNGYLAQLRDSGEYLLRLINDILDLSRMENGELAMMPVVCSEEQLFSSIINMVASLAQAKDQEFNFENSRVKWKWIRVDRERVKQIFVNLLSNAIKYTPEEGRIDFTMEPVWEKDGVERVKFVVRDNGIGMDENFIPHIFEPFKQEGRSVKAKGSGLGMPIVKQLVTQMGGTIEIKSEVNKGTEITLYLNIPLADAPASCAAAEVPLVDALRDRRILLCEDHPLNAQIMVKLLEKQGATVQIAENGRQGVDMFVGAAAGSFDAILMDIRMPVMDGIAAARAIRTSGHPEATTVPILALSANAFPEDVQKSLDAGMNGHLSKPVDPQELYRELARVMGR